MIDLDRVNMVTVMDRLNSKITDYGNRFQSQLP